MNRGADRQDIFSDRRDFDAFEDTLGRCADATSVVVHAYCLMTNHVHLVVAAPNGPSEFMRRLLGSHAVRYNQRHHRDGPLFRGRFLSVPVETSEQLPILVRYVHRNPLGVVDTSALAAYRYSSYPVYLDQRRAPDWLQTGAVLAGSSAEAHRSFVETDLPHDKTAATSWAATAPADLFDIVEAVVEVTGVPTSIVCTSDGTRRSDARAIAISLAVELRAASISEIAAFFSMTSSSSVRSSARRGRVRAADDPSFARVRERVLIAVWSRRSGDGRRSA